MANAWKVAKMREKLTKMCDHGGTNYFKCAKQQQKCVKKLLKMLEKVATMRVKVTRMCENYSKHYVRCVKKWQKCLKQ